MKNLQFPLQFIFKISTLSSDFIIKDFKEDTMGFIQQKLFKLVEEVKVYKEISKTNILYTIKADRWLDFSATYIFFDAQEKELGRLVRKGFSSLWKASYEIYDAQQKLLFKLKEKSWLNIILDNSLSEIPVLNLLTNYLFNPTYYLKDLNDKIILQLKKERTFLGRHFKVEKLAEFEKNNNEEECAILGLMMMLLLEKFRT